MTLEIQSLSSEDTLNLGERLGSKCRGGEVFLLSSDLGGGKTTLTKGIGLGLGCEETITSPTFTVSNSYKCRENLEIHHFDFYRLSEAGVVGSELEEILEDDQVITVIEWGEIVDDILPKDRITIEINNLAESEYHRSFKIKAPKKLNYVLDGLV